MLAYTLSEIRATGPVSYEVVLTSGPASTSFMMNVEGVDIEVVTWEEDFSRFVSYATGPASPIFEAVLRFHRARKVQLP